MDFNEYQIESRKTAIYKNARGFGNNLVLPLVYLSLGLNGEAGEVAEVVKKLIRDKQGVLDEKVKEDLRGELGDVLWYLANLATELGLDMNDIAQFNLDKLASRKARGVLQGSGDSR
jgi:NTP pyrophosphatase (non-canonical NTP hydrolase)